MAIPGRASIRQAGRTPNPYGGQSVHPSVMAGRATPAPSAVTSFAQTPLARYQTPFGQRAAPPSAGFGQSDPVGVNQRAALVPNDGGRGKGSVGWVRPGANLSTNHRKYHREYHLLIQCQKRDSLATSPGWERFPARNLLDSELRRVELESY
jgi:hypothetical protein